MGDAMKVLPLMLRTHLDSSSFQECYAFVQLTGGNFEGNMKSGTDGRLHKLRVFRRASRVEEPPVLIDDSEERPAHIGEVDKARAAGNL